MCAMSAQVYIFVLIVYIDSNYQLGSCCVAAQYLVFLLAKIDIVNPVKKLGLILGFKILICVY